MAFFDGMSGKGYNDLLKMFLGAEGFAGIGASGYGGWDTRPAYSEEDEWERARRMAGPIYRSDLPDNGGNISFAESVINHQMTPAEEEQNMYAQRIPGAHRVQDPGGNYIGNTPEEQALAWNAVKEAMQQRKQDEAAKLAALLNARELAGAEDGRRIAKEQADIANKLESEKFEFSQQQHKDLMDLQRGELAWRTSSQAISPEQAVGISREVNGSLLDDSKKKTALSLLDKIMKDGPNPYYLGQLQTIIDEIEMLKEKPKGKESSATGSVMDISGSPANRPSGGSYYRNLFSFQGHG